MLKNSAIIKRQWMFISSKYCFGLDPISERILNAGEKDKVINHFNSFKIIEKGQTQYTHDIAWHYCAILIGMITAIGQS